MTTPLAPRGRRLRRRLRLLAALSLLAVAAGVLALPALLGTEPARRWLLGRANAALAPNGGLEVAQFRFSWFGPTRMDGFAVTDAEGEPIVAAPTAVWDRPLGRILFDRPRYGTLTLEGATVDIERREDGSVDLRAALGPILGPDSHTDLTIRIREGSLRLRSPEFPRPLEADRLDLTIRRPPAPGLLTWRVALADGPRPGAALTILGDTDPWQARPGRPADLTLRLEGDRWPLDLVVEGSALSGQLDGRLRLARRGGFWESSGDASLAALEVRREAGSDPALVLDQIGGDWDVSQTAAGWVVRSLDVSSPLGSLNVQADLAEPGRSSSAPRISARVEGDLDLAALSMLVPELMPEDGRLERGHARLRLETTADNVLVAATDRARVVSIAYQADSPPASPLPPGAEVAVKGTIDVDGLLWSGQDGTLELPPHALSVRAAYREDGGAIDLEELVLNGPLGTVRATGRIDDLAERPRAEVQGAMDADWEAVRARVAEALDPEVYVDGGPVHFRLAGPLDGGPDVADLWRDLTIEARVDLETAEAYGLRAGPTTLSARSVEGELAIDPIRTVVNGGAVELFPELEIADDGLATLRLSPLSRVEDVEVNDEVSRRVLSYVAPIMAQATRARGRVSANVSRAEFPIDLGGAPSGSAARSAVVEGLVVFDDVAFAAGPLANDILDLVNVRGDRTLRLDQPVVLAIADGKVHQTGLAIPVAGITRIEMDGTVGFDQSLDLRTRVAITDEMFGRAEVLGAIADGVRITVPITGTLDRPKLDKDAFKTEMAAMGRDLLGRTAVVGGVELLRKALTPRDPEEAARRQAERERKREERRLRQEERRRARQG